MSETVIITGGTRGLGRAMVAKWLSEGWNVATCARNSEEVQELTREYVGKPLLAETIDIRNEEQVRAFTGEVYTTYGTIDILINNAGVLGPMEQIQAYSSKVWKDVMDSNLNGAFYFVQSVLPLMLQQRNGVILNITSGAGIKGKKNWGAYAASKFALEGFTQVLREELLDSHIRVHAVDPGKMRTQMRKAAYPQEDPSTLPTPEKIAGILFDIAAIYEPQLPRLSAVDYF